MSGWGNGYVTDIAYTAGHYPFQSPWHMRVACLLRSVRPPLLGPDLSYLELGCGRGHNALVLAAANPGWTVTGVDFHPAHIAEARRLAGEAGLRNVRFEEGDFADPGLPGRLPEADVVSLHGVWSWVAPGVRAGIVQVLKLRLRPGGLAHVSYNALPGWQGAVGMQRVLREAGLRTPGRSDAQAEAGLALVRDLAEAEASYMGESRVVRNTLSHASHFPTNYVAHEYMNAAWSPCFHMDVCLDLKAARLEWAASAYLTDSFPELSLTEAQRAIVNRYDDPLMRELVRDMCQERSLRNDIWVRGIERLTAGERDAMLRDVVLAPARPRSKFRFSLAVPAGEAELPPAFYGPVADHLAQGPCTVGDLLDRSGLTSRRENPAELVAMLVTGGEAIPVATPVTPGPGGAAALHNAVGARLEAEGALNARLAITSPALGAGIPCSLTEMAVWRQLARGQKADLAGLPARLLAHGTDEERARMAGTVAEALVELPPLWRALGVAPDA